MPPTSRRVCWSSNIAPGLAIACRRPARLDASPTTPCSSAPHPGQIAHDNEARCYADADSQRLAGNLELADAFDQGQPGPYRPLGIVFMSLGISKTDKNPTAHRFDNITSEVTNLFCNRSTKRPQLHVQILGVEPCRKCGRAP